MDMHLCGTGDAVTHRLTMLCCTNTSNFTSHLRQASAARLISIRSTNCLRVALLPTDWLCSGHSTAAAAFLSACAHARLGCEIKHGIPYCVTAVRLRRPHSSCTESRTAPTLLGARKALHGAGSLLYSAPMRSERGAPPCSGWRQSPLRHGGGATASLGRRRQPAQAADGWTAAAGTVPG